VTLCSVQGGVDIEAPGQHKGIDPDTIALGVQVERPAACVAHTVPVEL
jgi:hypothetical protein